MEAKLEIEFVPEPVMSPVEVKAPMLLALIVFTPKVAEVPLSVKVSKVLGVAAASLTVKVPSTPTVPKVKTGAAFESVNGEALDKVRAWLEVAPRAVTDCSVSASVPVTVMVEPEIETVLMPPPAMARSPCRVLSDFT